jgi:hypothetical protein
VHALEGVRCKAQGEGGGGVVHRPVGKKNVRAAERKASRRCMAAKFDVLDAGERTVVCQDAQKEVGC